MSSYRDLKAWKLAMQLACRTYQLVSTLPSNEKYALRTQIIRAVISVPANIAEGMGRSKRNDTLHFLYIARGSLYELETLFELAGMLQFHTSAEKEALESCLIETLKTLNGLIRYYKSATLN